jgi:heptosyltransferase-2
LSTAAIRSIREKFNTHYKISFLVGEQAKEPLLRCPYIDELLVADLEGKDKGFIGALNLGKQLRRRNFDILIDLQNNRKSHLICGLTRPLNSYGYDNKKLGFLLKYRIKDEKPPIDPVTHQFRILKLLGIDLLNPALELWPSKDDEQYIEEFLNAEWLSATQQLVGLNISASLKWLTKNWSVAKMAKLCEELEFKDMRVVLTGTEKDLAQADELISAARKAKIINACGKTTVNQLACLIKKCSCFVSSDSSPLHIAAAVNTPIVALFGPTDPRRHMPPAKSSIVIKKEMECAPCYKPKCKNPKCMKMITVEEVLEAIEKLTK